MIEMILSIVLVTLLFGFTIFIHELGHFLVARWCGMTVDAFAIGMGPAIWKRTVNGVEYKLCAFPIGGYVALPQMGPSEESGKTAEQEGRNLPPVKPIPKILVALAGVTFNMIFAVFLAYVIFWESKAIAPEYETSAVGYVETNSPAYTAGIRSGDIITAVNGESVSTWEQYIVVTALRDQVTLDLRRPDGSTGQVSLPTTKIVGGRIIPGMYPKNYVVVLGFVADSPAKAAGVLPRDRILRLDGQELFSREQMVDLINAAGGRPVALEIDRGGTNLVLSVTPRFNQEHQRAMIGIKFQIDEVKKPMDQIKSHATLIFRILKALVTPSESRAAAEAIGGPVAIIDIFLDFASMGLMKALWFACLLNVNLAVMNLLPLPVLDGGHIMFSLYELVFRRPVPARVVAFLWKVSALLLLGLFLLLTYRDVARIVSARQSRKDPAAAEQPAAPPAAEAPAPAAP
ncbi:MAG TPA: RIP metalloprotease RseP [Kiritimatiellia bacterium]|nr:RIP metalloprotease RseP [Kiritimatiellia bacterium]HMP34355.1 RIP metalloprotease RseP [Kiritimatiellia bacterium]